jgi:hypothetical protein
VEKSLGKVKLRIISGKMEEDKKGDKEAHAVYEWTPEMTKKAEEVLADIKFSFNENMYSAY